MTRKTCYPDLVAISRGYFHGGLLFSALLGSALLGSVTGCAGKANTGAEVAAAGANAAGGATAGANSAAGGATAGANAAAGNAGAAGTTAEPHDPNFIPDTAPDYDEKNGFASFEDSQGFGWDTCFTHTPEHVRSQSGDGADGTRYMAFESSDEPPLGEATSQPSTSQVYLYSETSELSENLYFDSKNFGTTAVSGSLRFYSTDQLCEQEQLLFEVDLGQLQLQRDWGTRCVTLSGLPEYALGIAVTGGVHSIGIDALRFGPPCHSQP
jgi:hypothetical protein